MLEVWMAVTIISCFEVPSEREGDFLALYHRVNDYMAQQPGFLGNKMHRALVPGARFAFVNIITWESLERFTAARDAGYLKLVTPADWLVMASAPYEVLHERIG